MFKKSKTPKKYLTEHIPTEIRNSPLNDNEIGLLINRFLMSSPKQLEYAAKNVEGGTTINVIMARMFLQAMTNPDPRVQMAVMEWCWTRTVGRVPQRIHIDHSELQDLFSEDELIEIEKAAKERDRKVLEEGLLDV